MSSPTVAIVGLGLLGGSLGLALKKNLPRCRIIGLSRSRDKIILARRKRIIDEGMVRPGELLKQADIIVICTPVSAIPSWITRSDQWAHSGALVTDVGSTKGAIVRWAEKQKFKNIHFVGSHPMAGSHHTGIEFAREDLFHETITFVTRTSRTHPAALKKIVAMWKQITPRVIPISPVKHDQIAAQISHLPHALASLLVLSIAPQNFPLASSGLRDTTRISQGDPAMWRDILITNSGFLAQELKKFRRSLDNFIRCLQKGNSRDVFNFLRKASRIRTHLEDTL